MRLRYRKGSISMLTLVGRAIAIMVIGTSPFIVWRYAQGISTSAVTVPSYGSVTGSFPHYGVNHHLWAIPSDGLGYSYPETKDSIVELAQSGSFWIRVDWCLSDGEDAWHVEFKNDMAALGIRELGILMDLSNDWPRRGFNLDDWKDAVAVAVGLAPNLPAWEIWNEPNLPEFQFGYQDGTPGHYMNMLREAYSIIKSVNPDAIVLAPSLFTGWGQTDINWLQSVINLGMLDYCDAVSIHLYEDLSTNKAIFNTVKSKVGDKPVWVTEFGYPSDYGESSQNNYLQQNFAQIPADVMIWYTLFDWAYDSSTWGLIRTDYTYKPAYYSFRSLVEADT